MSSLTRVAIQRVAQCYISRKLFCAVILIPLSSAGGDVAHMGRMGSEK